MPNLDARRARERNPFRSLRLGAAAGLLTLLAGCAGMGATTSDGPALASAPLPTYLKGERFSSGDGESAKVLETDGKTVVWQDRHKVVLTQSPNPIYAPIKRQARSSTTTRDFSPLDNGALFPLKVGNTASFGEDKTRTDNTSGASTTKRRFWRCAVDGTERLELAAGTFDTFRITCERVHRKRANKNKVQTFYYAPAVGHTVRVTYGQKYNRLPDKTVDLVAARPSLAALGVASATRQKAYASFQKALDNQQSGVTTTWRDPKSGVEVRTMVNGTFQRKDGSYCRSYLQEVSPNPTHRVYPGIACRSEDGRWRTPRG